MYFLKLKKVIREKDGNCRIAVSLAKKHEKREPTNDKAYRMEGSVRVPIDTINAHDCGVTTEECSQNEISSECTRFSKFHPL